MRSKMLSVFLVCAFLTGLLAPNAEAVPTVPATGLEVQITESGAISLSADGSGSNAASSIIEVNKPNAAATVRSAYFACASNLNRIIADGHVSLEANPITWSESVQNNAGGNITFFNNVFADVTAIVKPKVDAAAPGLVAFTQTEVTTGTIDGCGLYAIFDDPSQLTDNTVFILYGGQDTNGDDFAITLAQPLGVSDQLEMGLGISFSFQPSGMVSLIDVNGVRLTSSAGGQDDGAAANGALLTVGGIGDSTANPPPNDPASSTRTDDELYNLKPFLGPLDTSVFVESINPSDDDNIFTGHLFVTAPAIVGEGILLTPATSTNPVGTQHTVTARVLNDLGDPVVGVLVDFEVVSGPNAGTTGSGNTDLNGLVSFTYTGSGGPGTDSIVASFTDSQGDRQTSNAVEKIWEGGPVDVTKPLCELVSVVPGPPTKLTVNTQDLGSGLDSIMVTTAINATVVVPPFTVGTNGLVVVTATKINQAIKAQVALRVFDVAGNFTDCDPIITQLVKSNGGPATETIHNVPYEEHFVTVINGDPGLRAVMVIVNRKRFLMGDLQNNESRKIDVVSAMVEGDDNTIILKGRGRRGSSATIMISD